MKTLSTLTILLALTLTANSQERNPNIALHGTASASSTLNANFPASAANDGDRKAYEHGAGGSWADATPNVWGDWLEIAFDSPKSISRVTVTFLHNNFNVTPTEPTVTETCTTYGVKSYEIQVFNRLGVWQTVASETNNDKCLREHVFSPVRGSKARILIHEGYYQYSIVAELEVYGL
jgi:hypothetical protein